MAWWHWGWRKPEDMATALRRMGLRLDVQRALHGDRPILMCELARGRGAAFYFQLPVTSRWGDRIGGDLVLSLFLAALSRALADGASAVCPADRAGQEIACDLLRACSACVGAGRMDRLCAAAAVTLDQAADVPSPPADLQRRPHDAPR